MTPLEIVIYIGGAVLFFALVMASIALHEIGHLIPGKLFGVKTTQYFVGFGKTLWSRRRGETEYGVKAIPLGGYVRFVGMYPPDQQHPGRVRAARTGIFQTMADQARAAEWEDIRPEDDGRLFYQKKSWQKLIIMASGPVMNILLAFFLLWGLTGIYGLPRQTLTVNTVSECVVPASRADQTCQPGDPRTPAYAMGIRPGDVVQSFNGTRIESWDQMSAAIRDNLDRPAEVVVVRAGEPVTLPAVNTVITGVQDRWDPSKTVQAGFLGVSPVQRLERGGPLVVLHDMWGMTEQTAYAIVRFPAKVYHVAADLVTGQPRDVNGPMSIVGASRVAGEVAATDQLPAATKVAQGVALLGSVNLFVGLFNFVPLLPLDGGHIAGAIYEAIKRSLARLRGRSDPGHVDTAKMLPVAYVVGSVIALSGLILIVADVVDPIRLF
jgi:membrane-associated protease RseP (regulator of RpoE activity)